MIERDLAPVFVATDGFTGGDNVVLAEAGDMEVLGSHTLESLGVTVDPVSKKLVPTVGLALGVGEFIINLGRLRPAGRANMAKKITGSVKLQIAAGKATPAPPVGPALGQAQINIMEFCKQFNARTSAKELDGLIIPVVVSVYSDRTFTFITKTPPASILLKRAAGVAKGSGTPNKDKVGKVTEKQVLEIAKQKMPDLNAASVEAAVKSVKGTARSMGIEVTA